MRSGRSILSVPLFCFTTLELCIRRVCDARQPIQRRPTNAGSLVCQLTIGSSCCRRRILVAIPGYGRIAEGPPERMGPREPEPLPPQPYPSQPTTSPPPVDQSLGHAWGPPRVSRKLGFQGRRDAPAYEGGECPSPSRDRCLPAAR